MKNEALLYTAHDHHHQAAGLPPQLAQPLLTTNSASTRDSLPANVTLTNPNTSLVALHLTPCYANARGKVQPDPGTQSIWPGSIFVAVTH